jgi:phage FluMu gp28-like protein
VGKILVTREVLVLRQVSSPDQEAILRSRLQAADRTCYDYTGPGIGLGDYLVADRSIGQWKPEAHLMGKLELCTFTSAFKRLIFPRLRRAFEQQEIFIPISKEVREDLHAMMQTFNGNEYNYWSPRTREGHSDRCTAAALAIRAAGDGVSQDGFTGLSDRGFTRENMRRGNGL